MKKILLLIIAFSFILSYSFCTLSQSNKQDIYKLFLNFKDFYNSGNLFQAEECMFKVMESGESLPGTYMVAVYNNLGAVYMLLGRYRESLEYYLKAEEVINKNHMSERYLADIYINKARIYNLQKLFSYAIEYLEEGLRIYLETDRPDKSSLYNISAAYQNIGISYSGIKEYKTALEYFNKGAELKVKYNLSKIALSYLNMANVYVKTGDSLKAENFFLKSLEEFNREFGENYYRIVDALFDYSLFLRSSGRENEAIEYQLKSLKICLKNLGEKHPYVSVAYKYIGEHYSYISDYKTALYYYQKALVALIRDFNNPDINFNPALDSSLLDADLLDILRKKAEAWEKLALIHDNSETGRQSMIQGFKTIELAIQIISKLRNEYISEESQLYLMNNEKETYFLAIQIARELYTFTGNSDYLRQSYDIVKEAKSAVLRYKIKDNELHYSIGITDSLREKYQQILSNISAFNHLIHEEKYSSQPDHRKIELWKDALFKLNRNRESLEGEIHQQFPMYREILKRTETVTLDEIQRNLEDGETLVEYFLSTQYHMGQRELYIFIVTRDALHVHEAHMDSVFSKDVETIRQHGSQVQADINKVAIYQNYTNALFRMYKRLIKPVDGFFKGSKLIIIPDEEIAYLPFDVFIMNRPDPNHFDYEGLEYMIKKFSTSYKYSSSLINKKNKIKKTKTEVYAFAPDYLNFSPGTETEYNQLMGAKREIDAIRKWFKGKTFIGEEATENNFKSSLQYPVILHLAMHSFTDTVNSKYSFLKFDSGKDSLQDSNLYDFEINLIRVRSPLVVLSACNTGTGKLYQGEGIMSLTRAFILAGTSSVIKTIWDVNDEVSAKIIGSFYYYLYKGKAKDDALRLAKLEYLKTVSPAYADPYYWGAYQIMGDKTPVIKRNKNTRLFIIFIIITALGLGIGRGYFKRRRSFPA